MNQGSTVFAQVLDFLPKRQFRRCVARYCVMGSDHSNILILVDQLYKNS